MSLIQIEHVCKQYVMGGETIRALDDVFGDRTRRVCSDNGPVRLGEVYPDEHHWVFGCIRY
ncbi:hypothetical protein QFZ78_006449 [Paenibacillus sp. V4I5]|nr:hypothetical protein [Paenibacillus sp. V4I5]